MVPRPGRGTFVAAPPARNGDARPRLAGGRARRRADGRRRRARRAAGARRPGERSRSPPATSTRGCSRPPRWRRRSPAPARRPGAWERGPVEGVAALRAWFAREAGGRFGAHDVVICPGGQAALVTARARARAARRRGRRRVADLPRRARRGARGRASPRCPCPATPTACGRRCSPTRSSAPAPASPTCSRCTPTRTAPTCRRSGAPR